ncbi:MAG: hypothetical protein K2J73_01500 [Oscillospiraceae bacterium]|nr:hypothetical protein [Oscillospiraceae bacterium]
MKSPTERQTAASELSEYIIFKERIFMNCGIFGNGNNCCWIIIILLVLWFCCCNHNNSDNDCGCGCNNNNNCTMC